MAVADAHCYLRERDITLEFGHHVFGRGVPRRAFGGRGVLLLCGLSLLLRGLAVLPGRSVRARCVRIVDLVAEATGGREVGDVAIRSNNHLLTVMNKHISDLWCVEASLLEIGRASCRERVYAAEA